MPPKQVVHINLCLWPAKSQNLVALNVITILQRYMLKKALRVSSKHGMPSSLRWICNKNGQDYLLNTDLSSVLNPSQENAIGEGDYSTNSSSHDPIACLGRAYREKILSTALYNLMSPQQQLPTTTNSTSNASSVTATHTRWENIWCHDYVFKISIMMVMPDKLHKQIVIDKFWTRCVEIWKDLQLAVAGRQSPKVERRKLSQEYWICRVRRTV